MTRLATRARRGAWIAAATAGVAVGSTGCASISQQQEVELGQQYSAQIAQQLPLIRDPEVNRYINVLGDSLARTTARADLDWQFYIVDSPEVNAFAVPGGFIYINRGLIERAPTMSEVAGVLGHEIGHVVRRHSVKQMQQQQNANIGLTALCVLTPNVCANQAAATGIQLGAGAVFARFSRDDEAEADVEGVRTTTRAGIDPRGVPDMFRILLNERQSRPDAVSAWFATHPLEESRIQATTAQIQREVPSAVLASLTKDSRNYQAFKQRLASLPRTPQRQSAR